MEDPSQEVRRILVNNTVQEALGYLASVSRTVEESASSMKAVISESYKDLITACDRVVGMERTCRELLLLRQHIADASARAMIAAEPGARSRSGARPNGDYRWVGSGSSTTTTTVAVAANERTPSPNSNQATPALARSDSLHDIVALLSYRVGTRQRRAGLLADLPPSAEGAAGEVVEGASARRRRLHRRACTDPTTETRSNAVCRSTSTPDRTALRVMEQCTAVEGLIAADRLPEAAEVLAGLRVEIAAARLRMGGEEGRGSPRGKEYDEKGTVHTITSATATDAAGEVEVGEERAFWSYVSAAYDGYVRRALACLRGALRVDADALVHAIVALSCHEVATRTGARGVGRRLSAAGPSRGAASLPGSEHAGLGDGGERATHTRPAEPTWAVSREEGCRAVGEAQARLVLRVADSHRTLVRLQPNAEALNSVLTACEPMESAVPESVEKHHAAAAMVEVAARVLVRLARSILTESAQACATLQRRGRPPKTPSGGADDEKQGDGDCGPSTSAPARVTATEGSARAADILRDVLQLSPALFTDARGGESPQKSATRRSHTRESAAPATAEVRSTVGCVNDSAFALHLSLQSMVLHQAVDVFLTLASVPRAGGGGLSPGAELASTAARVEELFTQRQQQRRAGLQLGWQGILTAKQQLFLGSAGDGGDDVVPGSSPEAAQRIDSGGDDVTPMREGSAAPSPQASLFLSSTPPTRGASPALVKSGIGGGANSDAAVLAAVLVSDAGRRRRRRAYTASMLGAISGLCASELAEAAAMVTAERSIAAGGTNPVESPLHACADDSLAMVPLPTDAAHALVHDWRGECLHRVLAPLVDVLLSDVCTDPMVFIVLAGAERVIRGFAASNPSHAPLYRSLVSTAITQGLSGYARARMAEASDGLSRSLAALSLEQVAAMTTTESVSPPVSSDVFFPTAMAVTRGLCREDEPTHAPAHPRRARTSGVTSADRRSPRVGGADTRGRRGCVLRALAGCDVATAVDGGLLPLLMALGGGGDSGDDEVLEEVGEGGPDTRAVQGELLMRAGAGAGMARYPTRFFRTESAPRGRSAAAPLPTSPPTVSSTGAATVGNATNTPRSAGAIAFCALAQGLAALVHTVCRLPQLLITGDPDSVAEADAITAELREPLLGWLHDVAEALERAGQSLTEAATLILADMARQMPSAGPEGGAAQMAVVPAADQQRLIHALQKLWYLSSLVAAVRRALAELVEPTSGESARRVRATAAVSMSNTMNSGGTRVEVVDTRRTLARVEVMFDAMWQRVLTVELRQGLTAAYDELAREVLPSPPSSAPQAPPPPQRHSWSGPELFAAPAHVALPAQPSQLFRVRHADGWVRVRTGALTTPDAAAERGSAVYVPCSVSVDVLRLLAALERVLLDWQACGLTESIDLAAAMSGVGRGAAWTGAGDACAGWDERAGVQAVLLHVFDTLVTTFDAGVVGRLQEVAQKQQQHHRPSSHPQQPQSQPLPQQLTVFSENVQDAWLQIYLDASVACRVVLAHISPGEARARCGEQLERLLARIASAYDPIRWRTAGLAELLSSSATALLTRVALGLGMPASVTAPTSADSPHTALTPASSGRAAVLPSAAGPLLALSPAKEVARFSLLPIAAAAPVRLVDVPSPPAPSTGSAPRGPVTVAMHGRSGGGAAALRPIAPPLSQPLSAAQAGEGEAAGVRRGSASSLLPAAGGALTSALWGSTQRGWSSLWGPASAQGGDGGGEEHSLWSV